MDLFRTLRVSIYLLVASGAYAIWDMEQDPRYFLGVVLAAVVAYFTVDAKRIAPVRNGIAGIFSLALLFFYLMPALACIRDSRGNDAVALMTHFLCIIQTTLFFTAYRGSAIFTFCGSTLFMVIISGILNPTASLLLRLFFYFAATTWTLFLHALWRAHNKFEHQDTSSWAQGAQAMNAVSSRGTLSKQTFRQGLLLSGVLTVGCVIFGFMLFFAWPRLNTLGFLQNFLPARNYSPEERAAPGGDIRQTGAPREGSKIGFSQEGPDLSQLGPIFDDPSPALNVTFSPLPTEWAGPEGRIFLRAMAYSGFDGVHWRSPEKSGEPRGISAGQEAVEFGALEPQHRAPPGVPVQTVRQEVTYVTLQNTSFFFLAPIRRLQVYHDPFEGVLEDEEGSLRTLNDERLPLEEPAYEVLSSRPVRADELPLGARARSPGPRYTQWRDGIPAVLGEQMERLVSARLNTVTGDVARARRLCEHLRDSGEYHYSLRGAAGNLNTFLFGEQTQRRGACGYFATAHVLFCRAAGLPARLATGYAHTIRTHESLKGEITFQNREAHAWSEVYFDRYGWVTFDPTPASLPDMASVPPEANKEPAAGKSLVPEEPRTSTSSTYTRSWFKQGWDYVLDYDRQEQDRVFNTLGNQVGNFFSSLGQMLSSVGSWSGGGVLFFWLLGAGLVVLVVLLLRGQDQRKGAGANLPPRARAAVHFYNDLLQVLGKRGFVRRPGQTPREFAEAVVRRGGNALSPVMEVTGIFESVRYGGEDIGAEQLDRLRRAFEALRDSIPGQIGEAAVKQE